jgi:hypothetical protein
MNWGNRRDLYPALWACRDFCPAWLRSAISASGASPEPTDGDENPARLVRYLQDFFSFSKARIFALPFGQTVLY